jgi:acetyltransferase
MPKGQGLGATLFRKLIEIARDEGLSRLSAEMLPDNLAMRRIADKLGFRTARAPISSSLTALLESVRRCWSP